MSSEAVKSVVSRIVHRPVRRRAQRRRDGEAWCADLEQDFYRRHEDFDLTDARDRLLVRSTAAGDLLVRTVMASVVGTVAMPLGFHPLALRRDLADRSLYREAAAAGDPDRFFRPPPRGVHVQRRPVRSVAFQPRDGRCVDLRFKSPYECYNPRLREAYSQHHRNGVAHARYWHHEDGPRPTIIAVHGFGAEQHWLNVWFQGLRRLYLAGYDVAHFTLPFHGPRQTRFSLFSGSGFFAGGISRINEAFGQSVLDCRILANYLLDTVGAPRVGITGVSLGGYTSALMAAVEPRLDFAIPNVPVVSLSDLILEWQPLSLAVRAAMKVIGASVVDARQVLAVASPLTYAPRLPQGRLMIIGGAGDRVAPPKHSRLLWEHWGRCRIHWFPGSHLLHLDRGEYLHQMLRFLREVGFPDDAASFAQA